MIQIDMPMPDNCDECRFNTEYCFCKAMPNNFCGNTDDMKRPEWCPLKEQEAKTVIKIAKRFNDCDLTGFCPFCSRPLIKDWAENYCGYCGEPILWKGQ